MRAHKRWDARVQFQSGNCQRQLFHRHRVQRAHASSLKQLRSEHVNPLTKVFLVCTDSEYQQWLASCLSWACVDAVCVCITSSAPLYCCVTTRFANVIGIRSMWVGALTRCRLGAPKAHYLVQKQQMRYWYHHSKRINIIIGRSLKIFVWSVAIIIKCLGVKFALKWPINACVAIWRFGFRAFKLSLLIPLLSELINHINFRQNFKRINVVIKL